LLGNFITCTLSELLCSIDLLFGLLEERFIYCWMSLTLELLSCAFNPIYEEQVTFLVIIRYNLLMESDIMISHTQYHLKSLGHYRIHYFMESDFMISHTQLSSQITLCARTSRIFSLLILAMLLFSLNPLTVPRSGKWPYAALGCKAACTTTTFS